MGNQQHTQYSVLQMPSEGNWKQSTRTDHCLIIKNQQTLQEAEVYRIGINDERALDNQLAMYEYRKTNQTQLVGIINVQKAESSGLCSGSNSYKVITQRIPLRLSRVDKLQLPQAMYVLKQCLSGFELIHNSIDGPINITKQMIGFTPEGKVKIWVNSNFAVNMPDRQSYIRGQAYQYDESIMPLTLYKLVEEQMIDYIFPQQFKVRIDNQQRNTLKFSRMLQILRNFCIQYNIPSLQRLNLYEIEDYGDFDMSSQPKITVIQDTIIQRTPPKQLMDNNTSIIYSQNQTHRINNHIQYPIQNESHIKDRALPNNSEIYQQVIQAHKAPIRVNQNSQLNYQVNFPLMNQLSPPRISHQQLSFNINQDQFKNYANEMKFNQFRQVPNPQINYQQAITYEQRPSLNYQRANQVFPQIRTHLNHSPPKPYQHISSIPVQSFQSNSNGFKQPSFLPSFKQSYQPPKIKTFESQQSNQYNHNNNTFKLPLDFSNNHNHLNIKPQHEQFKYRPSLQSNLLSYKSSQTASFGNSNTKNKITQPKFELPSYNSERDSFNSPMKNDLYLTNGFSSEKSVQSFRFQQPFNKYQTPYKHQYEYSTSAKKQHSYDFDNNFGDIKKPLFTTQYTPQFKPKPLIKNDDNDLLKRIDQLTNQISEVTSSAGKQVYNEMRTPSY